MKDCAERALGLLAEFNTNCVTKDETQQQALLQVVRQSAHEKATETGIKQYREGYQGYYISALKRELQKILTNFVMFVLFINLNLLLNLIY